MAGLKELRTRIETIKSTQKITSAMKMVAASSLRKAQGLIASSVPYRENILSPLENVVSEFRTLEQNGTFVKWPRMIAGSENDRTYLLLVFTSDRGLCGNFNASVAKVAAGASKNCKTPAKRLKSPVSGAKDILSSNAAMLPTLSAISTALPKKVPVMMKALSLPITLMMIS